MRKGICKKEWEKRKKEDALKFVEHIQKHIDDGDIEPLIQEPQCKVCGMYLSEIVKEESLNGKKRS